MNGKKLQVSYRDKYDEYKLVILKMLIFKDY